jgi:lysozyme family protein
VTDGIMTDRFELCWPFTLAQECPFPNDWANPRNFSNDAHDPGGKTMCGIIQREYDVWRKSHSLPPRDVRQLTQVEGEAIYSASYWDPECPVLPAGLDLCYFDEAVNAGTTEATKVLQYTLGVKIDGDWGPQTAKAVTAIGDVGAVIRKFTDRRLRIYQEMPGFKYFGKDWTRRTTEIGVAALKMAAESPR